MANAHITVKYTNAQQKRKNAHGSYTHIALVLYLPLSPFAEMISEPIATSHLKRQNQHLYSSSKNILPPVSG